MRIYLTQHGQAVPKETDPERPLSDQGRHDMQRLAVLLKHAGVHIDQVLHSGKLRAEQTASEIAAGMGLRATPGPIDGLGPNDPVEPIAGRISGWSGDSLVVGHQPHLARLAALLLTGAPDRPLLAFQPGSLACLERDPEGRWVLVWMVRPDLLAPAHA